MKKDIVRQVIVVVAVVATLVVNILANALPLNGQTTGDISDQFDVYFVPAGYVFAIWGLIYAGLIAYAVYQVLPAQRENERLQNTGYLVVVSCVANIAWLFLWHYNLLRFTLVAMVTLLLSLIFIYQQLEIGLKPANSTAEKWAVNIPFSIYLGWITVATVANMTSFLYNVNWSGWGIDDEVWALVMLAVATALGAAMSLTRGDVAYLLVLAWAFAGIAARHSRTSAVAAGAMAATIVVIGLIVVAIYRPRTARARQPTVQEQDLDVP